MFEKDKEIQQNMLKKKTSNNSKTAERKKKKHFSRPLQGNVKIIKYISISCLLLPLFVFSFLKDQDTIE